MFWMFWNALDFLESFGILECLVVLECFELVGKVFWTWHLFGELEQMFFRVWHSQHLPKHGQIFPDIL